MKGNKFFVIAILALAAIGFAVFKFSYQDQQQSDAPQVASSDLIKEHSPSLGPVDAPVQIVEFLDPECEACRALDPMVKGLMKQYEGKVRLVVRYMPFHGNSLLAATSLEEARDQGKYWEALSTLFYYQPQWGDHHNPKPELIAKYLIDLGIKPETLKEASLMQKHKWKVDLDFEDGKKVGVKATPTFFINGKMLTEIGYEPLKKAIESELSK
ncbi:MAG: thioredoxin domain-containing protein [Pseudobdellovibrionaceae bacterium]